MKKSWIAILPVFAGFLVLLASCEKGGMGNNPMNAPVFELPLSVEYDGTDGILTTDLMAGKYTKVGVVTVFTEEDGDLTVTYEITESGWVITETHLYVNEVLYEGPVKIGEFEPGLQEFNPGVMFVEYNNIDFDGSTVYILAHAVVQGGGGGHPVNPVLPAEADVTYDLGVPDCYVWAYISNGGILDSEDPYEGWCIDLEMGMDGAIDPYHVKPISSYSPEFFDLDLIEIEDNMDLVNWILNQDFVGKVAGDGLLFTSGDVQVSIWNLIDGVSSTYSGTGPWTQNHVDEIIAAAIPNDGFSPVCGQVFAIALVPFDGEVIPSAQVIIIPYPVYCYGEETAWGAGLDVGDASWAMYFTYPW